jgi:2',3'-cyclic-nucleotide 2'-phosphodiesterase (5'-nucleotidase family)
MKEVERICGKKVHIGVANFGGIRVDMPKGDVILDDILSMFPFRNNVIYIEHKGKTIRKILESMASGRFEVLGGVKVVAEDGRLVSVEIDGEPLDDEKVYGLATNSFLLNGGDGLYLASDALLVQDLGLLVNDVVLEHIKAETAAGRALSGRKDGRVTIR